jgi:hypothetical protein
MPRIDLQYLIKPTISPEQEIFLNHFFVQFDNRSAVNRHIANVEPLYFSGVIAGTEFLVYAATKLYICLNMLACYPGVPLVNPAYIITYDAVNATMLYLRENVTYWDTTAANVKYAPNDLVRKNLYFSRITAQSYERIIFNGYRITLD